MIGIPNTPALRFTRREAIVGLGAIGTGLALANGRSETQGPPNSRLHKIIYDDRAVEGRAFGARFASAGIPTAIVRDDPTWLWFDDLHTGWQTAGVAGLTTPAVALSLRLMAELAGLRAIFWGRHATGSANGASHLIAAPEPVLARWKDHGASGSAWTGALHDMIITAAAQPTTGARIIHASGARAGGGGEMVSWLLAPVRKGSA